MNNDVIVVMVILILLVLYLFKRYGDVEKTDTDIEKETKQDPYRTGKQFEDWALYLFPAESFNIIHKTVGGADLNGRFTEDCVNPDYKFRDLATNEEFWVECKYRSHRGEKGNLEWTDDERLQRYKEIRRRTGTPVYVLIGLGGRPDDPEELFFFNLDELGYKTLFYGTQNQIRIGKHPYGSLAERWSRTGVTAKEEVQNIATPKQEDEQPSATIQEQKQDRTLETIIGVIIILAMLALLIWKLNHMLL